MYPQLESRLLPFAIVAEIGEQSRAQLCGGRRRVSELTEHRIDDGGHLAFGPCEDGHRPAVEFRPQLSAETQRFQRTLCLMGCGAQVTDVLESR